jgi:acetyl/propionyl-CoA carboxylase alpha subunit
MIKDYQPASGPWVRVDSGVVMGSEITLFYDPLFAKLIVWAENRELAIARMTRALKEFRIVGVKTTIPFHRKIMANERFRRGDYHTGFINEEMEDRSDTESGAFDGDVAIAALLAHLKEGKGQSHLSTVKTDDRSPTSAWRRKALGESVGRYVEWMHLREGKR